LHSQQHFALLPQLFQVIISAQLGGKDVNDDIQIVKQHPAREWFPLHMMRKDAQILFGRLAYGVSQSL